MSSLVFTYVPVEEHGGIQAMLWVASSFYESSEEHPERWEIYCNRHGIFTVDCSDWQMVDGMNSETGPVHCQTLEEAKRFAEECEYELQCSLERLGYDVMPALRRREDRNNKLEDAVSSC